MYENIDDPCALTPKEVFEKECMTRKVAIGQKISGDNEEMDIAVHIKCGGDLESCQISASHLIFTQAATDVSTQIGFLILIRRIPGGDDVGVKRSDVSTGMSPWVNVASTFFNVGCQPKRKHGFPYYMWSFARPEWQNSVEAVTVARQDKKELLPEHVEVLVDYSENYPCDFFQAQIESEDCNEIGLRLGNSQVLKEISERKFEEYFQAWKKRDRQIPPSGRRFLPMHR